MNRIGRMTFINEFVQNFPIDWLGYIRSPAKNYFQLTNAEHLLNFFSFSLAYIVQQAEKILDILRLTSSVHNASYSPIQCLSLDPMDFLNRTDLSIETTEILIFTNRSKSCSICKPKSARKIIENCVCI